MIGKKAWKVLGMNAYTRVRVCGTDGCGVTEEVRGVDTARCPACIEREIVTRREKH